MSLVVGRLVLGDGDEEELRRLVRSFSLRAGLAQRARIVLLAAEGVANTEIAGRVGVAWRGWRTARAAGPRAGWTRRR